MMDERSDISGVVGALAVHVDALHWNELLSLFAPEVRIDYTSLFGGECEVMARERLIDNWRQLLPGLTRTCHVIGAPAITLNGETAQVSASVAAWHFVKEPEFARHSSQELEEFRRLPFTEVCFRVVKPFTLHDVPEEVLWQIVSEAINFPIRLVSLSPGLHILELFHGPTLAFKDFGARFMARLMGYFVRGESRPLTVLVATSGDTGSAVAHGFLGVPGIRVVILYPSKRISEAQEKQFTTLGENITALEVAGTFDDCQRLVKQAFSDV